MPSIALGPSTLDFRFGEGKYGLSARRLWEYTELGQVGIFSRSVSVAVRKAILESGFPAWA